MRKKLLLLLAFMMPMMAFAQYINEKKAREIAASVLKKNTVRSGRRSSVVDAEGRYQITDPYLELHRVVKNDENDEPCYYIYNQKGAAGGFAIVSNQGQLLVHSNRDSIDYDNASGNFKWLLEHYRKILSIKCSQPYPEEGDGDKIEGIPSFFRHSIEPMIGSEWSQDRPFNNLIKEKYESSGATAEEIVAGCTTIAMAQTMFFWKHPRKGTGTKKFKIGKETYTVNFEDPIDWDHIGPSPYWQPSTPEALADLSYRVAASLDSKVEDGETSAYAGDVPEALTTYFDYDACVRDESSFFYSAEVFEDIAYTELENGRPCIIYGQDGYISLFSSGHTMVVEGYDANTNHFYINMGWGSVPEGYEPPNAYYALTVKNGYHTFVVFQHIITHIMPNKGGKARPHIGTSSLMSIQQAARATGARRSIEYDKNGGNRNLSISTQIYSKDIDASIITGMMAKDFVTGQEFLFEGSALNLAAGVPQDITFEVDLDEIKYNGYYQLRPIFRMSDDNEWFSIEIQPQNEEEGIQPIYVDVSNANILDIGQEVDFSLDRTTIEFGFPAQIKYKLPIKNVPVSFISSDSTIVSVDENGLITAHKPGEVTITAHCDDYYFNGNRLVKETTREFMITSKESIVDHQVELCYFFPYELESDEKIHIKNHIGITPAYLKPGFSTKIEYTLGFFRDNEFVKKGYSWSGQYMSYNLFCQYESTEYLSRHQDLPDGEYELRLLYRIPGETPEGGFWIMPTKREDEAKVFMTLEKGHATFRQINKHPCELQVDSIYMSTAIEVGLQNTITVDFSRTSELDYKDYSEVFVYVDGIFVGYGQLDLRRNKVSASYIVNDFGYTYYFTPEHAGNYNLKVFDGRHHILYDKNIEVNEAKNYQLRVNNVTFHNSNVPNTANNDVKIELEIENIGEYRYTGDVVCRPVIPESGIEDSFWPPRFQLDTAPGEIVKQILPMDFDSYFESNEFIIVKCYYTSNGKDTVLWQSEKLTYIDPKDNTGISDIQQQLSTHNVYTPQGIVVGRKEQLNDLPAGLYIINKKKILKR